MKRSANNGKVVVNIHEEERYPKVDTRVIRADTMETIELGE